ncbi:integral component of membrane [Sergentomyia squamirostris]
MEEKRGVNVAKSLDGRVLLNPATAGGSAFPMRSTNVATVTFTNEVSHPHHSSYPEKGYRSGNGHHHHTRTGVVNPGFAGSSTTMRSESTPSVQVIREQYWTCFVNWTRRERILFLIVTFLTLIVLALVLLVSLLNKKDELNVPPPGSWFSWSL